MRDNMPRPKHVVVDAETNIADTKTALFHFIPLLVVSSTLGCSIAIGVMRLVGVL